MAPYILWSGVLELSYGVEYWSGVESNFGVAKILISLADSVYLTILISGLVFFELTSGQGIDLKHLLHIYACLELGCVSSEAS